MADVNITTVKAQVSPAGSSLSGQVGRNRTIAGSISTVSTIVAALSGQLERGRTIAGSIAAVSTLRGRVRPEPPATLQNVNGLCFEGVILTADYGCRICGEMSGINIVFEGVIL